MADTIAAIATGKVKSAVGIVRVSGDGAIAALEIGRASCRERV